MGSRGHDRCSERRTRKYGSGGQKASSLSWRPVMSEDGHYSADLEREERKLSETVEPVLDLAIVIARR